MNRFFDRHEALTQIDLEINKIKQDKSVAVWIEGGSGVGKSFLLKHIHNNSNISFFTYDKEDFYFKCEKGASNKKYELISAIIYEIKRTYPVDVEKFIQNFFNNAEHISILDACCNILPQIKLFSGVSKLIEKEYSNIVRMQESIHDQLLECQIIDFFASLIFDFFSNKYKFKNIALCIDDVQWIDLLSLKVILKVIRISRSKGADLKISLFLSLRDKNSLDDKEKEIYTDIYKQIIGVFPDLKAIYLDNFNYPTTSELLQSTCRRFLIENSFIIYQITKGNPLELDRTIRFTDKRIQMLIQKNEASLSEHFFTNELISTIYFESRSNTVILSIMSILKKNISLNTLFLFTKRYYEECLNDICLQSEFFESLQLFENNNIISYNLNGTMLTFKHDSIWDRIQSYLIESGDYKSYAENIAYCLLDDNDDSSNLLLALNLLQDVNPLECFNLFKKNYYKNLKSIQPEMYETASQAFSSLWMLTTEDYHFAVNSIIPKLVSFGQLKDSKRMCNLIYRDFKNNLNYKDQITFLINYIKTQVDLSDLDFNSESAIQLFENLINYEFYNCDIYLQALILGMSAYEHTLNHVKINNLFSKAICIVSENEGNISPSTLSIFYRNKGLCFPHSELMVDYFKALSYARKVKDITSKYFLYGTSINNVGLSYFYSGQIEKAKKAFFISLKHLEKVGYNTARIYNNIGCCFYILKDYKNAYSYFSISATNQTDGIFMKSCIQTNLALSLYAINKKSESKKILDDLIQKWNDGLLLNSDTLAYCAALINRGYIAFLEGDYFDSAKNYKKSLIHNYRFQNEEQTIKRKTMMDLSIALAMEDNNCSNENMDLDDTTYDFYKKPYSLIPFAFYVV